MAAEGARAPPSARARYSTTSDRWSKAPSVKPPARRCARISARAAGAAQRGPARARVLDGEHRRGRAARSRSPRRAWRARPAAGRARSAAAARPVATGEQARPRRGRRASAAQRARRAPRSEHLARQAASASDGWRRRGRAPAERRDRLPRQQPVRRDARARARPRERRRGRARAPPRSDERSPRGSAAPAQATGASRRPSERSAQQTLLLEVALARRRGPAAPRRRSGALSACSLLIVSEAKTRAEGRARSPDSAAAPRPGPPAPARRRSARPWCPP